MFTFIYKMLKGLFNLQYMCMVYNEPILLKRLKDNSLPPTAIQNEVDLLHVVITLPEGQDGTRALLCFVDELTDKVVKEAPLPTWEPVMSVSFMELCACEMCYKYMYIYTLQTACKLYIAGVRAPYVDC